MPNPSASDRRPAPTGNPAAWETEDSWLIRRRARDAGALLDVASYDIVLDLTAGVDLFSSRTEVRFGCRREGAQVVAGLHPVNVRRAVLNDTELIVDDLQTEGGLRLPGLGPVNTLTAGADFPYARVGKGLNRVAADDSSVLYSWANNGGASRIFCCFDQPDLRAPMRLAVHAPAGLTCRANTPVVARPTEGEQGQWRFAATPPLAPHLLAFYVARPRSRMVDQLSATVSSQAVLTGHGAL